MKKISLQKDLFGENDISQQPTERVAAVTSSTSLTPETQGSTNALITITGVFFVAVQILLLARFLLHSLMPVNNAAWIGVIYTISGIFDFPFHLLFQWLPLPIPGSVELYTLLAILCYGLLSRAVVRFCKAVIPLLSSYPS